MSSIRSRRRPRPWSPWAREYARTPDRYIWGRDASPYARLVRPLLTSGARVLDLGCGEGRDSVFFAAAGCTVIGVDVSLSGLRKARHLAADRRARPWWICAAMPDLPLRGLFELVYSCGTVHYVARAEREHFFRGLRALSPPGGYQLHVVFTDHAVHEEKGERIDYFEPGELARAYEGWSVLRSETGLIPCAQDGIHHVHSVDLLIVRRPPALTTGPSRPA
jgi:tellurite methyltransferase